MRALMLFFPTELLVLVLVAAGLALLIGARTLARTLAVFAGCMALLPVLLEPLFASLPDPILTLVLIGLGVAMLFVLVRALGVMLIGRRSTEGMVASLRQTSSGRRCVGLSPLRAGWRAHSSACCAH